MARYYWICPQCGTKLSLNKRVTQTKRRCPHCGTPITVVDIDATMWRLWVHQVLVYLIGWGIIIGVLVWVIY